MPENHETKLKFVLTGNSEIDFRFHCLTKSWSEFCLCSQFSTSGDVWNVIKIFTLKEIRFHSGYKRSHVPGVWPKSEFADEHIYQNLAFITIRQPCHDRNMTVRCKHPGGLHEKCCLQRGRWLTSELKDTATRKIQNANIIEGGNHI